VVETPSRATLSVLLAIVGGLMLLLGGASGSLGLYGFLLSLLAQFLPPPYDFAIYLLMMVLAVLASLGGATVMAGAYLIYIGRVGLGRLFISIGSGTGIVGFAVLLISEALKGIGALLAFLTTITSSVSWMGVLLSLAAMVLAKKPEERREERPEVLGRARVVRVARP